MAKLFNSFSLSLVIASVICVFTLPSKANTDTYSTFATTKYYSANKRYFLKVTPTQRATFYRINKGKLKILWKQTLEGLPGEVLISNNGSRVSIIGQYGGNHHNRKAQAVIILDETGRQLTYVTIGELVDLSKEVATISNSHWLNKAELTPDNNYLNIETVIAKRDRASCDHFFRSTEEADDCTTSIPYERIRFSLKTGEIVFRTKPDGT